MNRYALMATAAALVLACAGLLPDRDRELLDACIDGDARRVSRLLARGADVHSAHEVPWDHRFALYSEAMREMLRAGEFENAGKGLQCGLGNVIS